jgi:hypothetical protein
LRKLSRKSELAKAFRYMRSRWKALLRCFDEACPNPYFVSERIDQRLERRRRR